MTTQITTDETRRVPQSVFRRVAAITTLSPAKTGTIHDRVEESEGLPLSLPPRLIPTDTE